MNPLKRVIMKRQQLTYKETSSTAATNEKGQKKKRKIKTGVINDPLGQTHSLASSEHCFLLKYLLNIRTDGRTIGRYVRKQLSLPTVTLGRPRGSKMLIFSPRSPFNFFSSNCSLSNCTIHHKFQKKVSYICLES